MNTITVTDPTNSDFIYLCDWVAVTFRGYNEEDHKCASLSALLEYIQNDDENWDYQPRLRIRRLLSFYAGDIRTARDDNNLEEVYWTPGTPSEFQSSRCMPRTFIVPERFVREVAEAPPAEADAFCGLLSEVLEVYGAKADDDKGSSEWQARAERLEHRITEVLKAMDTSYAPRSMQTAITALRRLNEGG